MLNRLKKKHLKNYIDTAYHLQPLEMPKNGWIKTLREYFGMTVHNLANRVGVVRSRVAAIEKAEVNKSIKLETMEKVANALNCDFVYALVPREDLDGFLRKSAEHKAIILVKQLNDTMGLEDQSVDAEELDEQKKQIIKELLKTPKNIWND